MNTTTRTPANLDATDAEWIALNAAREAWGGRWRSRLRQAWESGNYRPLAFDLAATLQRMRNERGPEWLARFRFN